MTIEKIKISPQCKINSKNEKAELLIYGPIMDEKSWWYDEGEYACPLEVKKLLDSADGKDLIVRINSYGGSVFAGIAINNLLKSYEGNIEVVIDGIAASAASIIAMAGDSVKMPKNSMLMIHNAWTISAGNAKEFRKLADDLEKINDSIVATYMSKVSIEENELKALLDNETYLTAQESLDLGFIDSLIDEDKNLEPKEDVKNTILSKYRARIENSKKDEDLQVNGKSFLFNKFKEK